MLSNLFANFALVASSLSFERYIKFIPPILSLQKLNITAEVKILSLDALPKLANLVNLLSVPLFCHKVTFHFNLQKRPIQH